MNKYVRFAGAGRLVTLEEWAPLGYVDVEPPRFVLRTRDALTGELLTEVRYALGAEARRAYARRVRQLLGDAPERARRLRRYAQHELERALDHETVREGARAVRWWDVERDRVALRDRCLTRAQIADQNARQVMREVTPGVTRVTPQNVTDGSAGRQD